GGEMGGGWGGGGKARRAGGERLDDPRGGGGAGGAGRPDPGYEHRDRQIPPEPPMVDQRSRGLLPEQARSRCAAERTESRAERATVPGAADVRGGAAAGRGEGQARQAVQSRGDPPRPPAAGPRDQAGPPPAPRPDRD